MTPFVLRALATGWLELVLPRRCHACDAALPEAPGVLCRPCRSRLPRWLPDEDAAPALPPLQACTAAWRYEGEVEDWIQRFKYPAAGLAGLDPAPTAVVRGWARELAVRVPGSPPEWVVPVPLHRRRLARRGFNPAALLARELARTRRLALAPRALVRVRDTPSQTGLDRRGRRRNVTGAFRIRSRRRPLPGRVWLVDDVVTTGATLCEAARVLGRAGVQEVVGVCLARVR